MGKGRPGGSGDHHPHHQHPHRPVLGLSAGIGVVISQFYGAKEEEKVGQAVQTSLLLVLLLCGVFTAVGIAMVPGMLRLMATPADVFPQAARYLRIYFAGVSGADALQPGGGYPPGGGDARRPLYSPLLGGGEHRAGPAVCGGVPLGASPGRPLPRWRPRSCRQGLVLGVLTRSRGCYRIQWRGCGCTESSSEHLRGGGCPRPCSWPSLLLQCVCAVPMSNPSPPPAWPGGRPIRKIDAFVILPMTTLSVTATTFVGQNVGAGNGDRAKQGFAVPGHGHGGDRGPFGPR